MASLFNNFYGNHFMNDFSQDGFMKLIEHIVQDYFYRADIDRRIFKMYSYPGIADHVLRELDILIFEYMDGSRDSRINEITALATEYGRKQLNHILSETQYKFQEYYNYEHTHTNTPDAYYVTRRLANDIEQYLEYADTNTLRIAITRLWFYASGSFKMSEDFMRTFKKELDWTVISRYQNLSQQFMHDFQDELNWYHLCMRQSMTRDFVFHHADKIDITRVLENARIKLNAEDRDALKVARALSE